MVSSQKKQGIGKTSNICLFWVKVFIIKAKKPGAVKPQEVEKLKDEIKIAYDKAPEEKKDVFDKQMQTIEKEVEKEVKIAESLKKK